MAATRDYVLARYKASTYIMSMPRVTGIVADWTGPSSEPEGHRLHDFKIRALLVTTYTLLLKNTVMQDMDMMMFDVL